MSFNKGEVTMRNYFKLLLLIMLLAISGCGSGATSADPLGTDTISVIAAPTSLLAGESSVITATVKHADGKAATLRSVSFSIALNNSGGTITVNDDGKNNGIATAIYTAGTNTPTISAQDTVKAIIENGASAVVPITRTGSATPPAGAILTLTPSILTPLAAGQNCTITANVTDSAGVPLSGVTVTFTIPVNNSGAPALSAASVVTDGSGNASTIYIAGTGSSTTSVDDKVQASLANGSTKLQTITRTAGAAATGTYAVSVSPSPVSVSAGQVSIITATVTNGLATAAGVAVTFTLPINSSGATLSAATATTDGTGKAVVIYQPGVTSPTLTVQDTVQAAVGTATSAVAITRTGSATAATTTYAVSVSPSTGTTPVTAGQVSIITATVTSTSGSTSTPAGGVTVNFTLPINSSGATLSAATATTDVSGKAVVIYQPGVTSPTLSIQDTVQAAVGTATSAVAITRTGSSTSAFSITLGTTPPAPSTLPITGGSSVITATVKNNLGTAVSGVTVTFVQTGGTSVLPAAPITDGSGNAVTVFTGPAGVAGTQAGVITASITIGVSPPYTAAVVILY
jgi:hypothetical protein